MLCCALTSLPLASLAGKSAPLPFFCLPLLFPCANLTENCGRLRHTHTHTHTRAQRKVRTRRARATAGGSLGLCTPALHGSSSAGTHWGGGESGNRPMAAHGDRKNFHQRHRPINQRRWGLRLRCCWPPPCCPWRLQMCIRTPSRRALWLWATGVPSRSPTSSHGTESSDSARNGAFSSLREMCCVSQPVIPSAVIAICAWCPRATTTTRTRHRTCWQTQLSSTLFTTVRLSLRTPPCAHVFQASFAILFAVYAVPGIFPGNLWITPGDRCAPILRRPLCPSPSRSLHRSHPFLIPHSYASMSSRGCAGNVDYRNGSFNIQTMISMNKFYPQWNYPARYYSIAFSESTSPPYVPVRWSPVCDHPMRCCP